VEERVKNMDKRVTEPWTWRPNAGVGEVPREVRVSTDDGVWRPVEGFVFVAVAEPVYYNEAWRLAGFRAPR
jgi:hypothetical protein